MELGPDLIVLLMHLRDLDPATLDRLLQYPARALARDPTVPPAPAAAVEPAGIRNAVSTLPSHSIVEKFRMPEADPLLPHYATFLPPYNQVFPGSEEAQFSDILTLAKAEYPIMLVGVMRNNTPKLVPLWGPARHLDPPYARTMAHTALVMFYQDVVHGNFLASTLFHCD
jgi:hypothetical protein